MKIKVNTESAVFRTAVMLALFFAGFLLSGADMAGVASFADISLCGALKMPFSTAVLSGSLVHCTIEGSVGKNAVKTASMVLIVILKMFFESRDEPKICGVFTGVSVFVSGTAVSAVIGEVFYKLIFYLFYAVLSGFTAFSASTALKGIKKRSVIDLSASEGSAYAVVYTVLVSSLCSVEIPFVNAGIIAGSTVTMLSAYYFGLAGGAVCGALTACGAFLASVQCGMTVVLLPVTALLAGCVNRRKTASFALCFTAVSFFLTALSGVTQESIYGIIDSVISAVLFIIVSPYCSDRRISAGRDRQSEANEMMSARINFLSDSIDSVRGEAVRISEIFSEKYSAEGESVEKKCAEVCGYCTNRNKCWCGERTRTLCGFRQFSDMCEISAETFPAELSECIKKQEICMAFESAVCRKIAEKSVMLKCSESRELFYEQMGITGELVRFSAERSDIRYSESTGRTVMNKLMKFGVFPKRAIAFYNRKNRLNIEIYFEKTCIPESFGRVCDLIADELRIKAEYSPPADSGREVRLRICEKPEYSAEVYTASRCAEGETESGDTSLVFSDGTGIVYAVLSDGMGSGKSACIESRLAVKLFHRLVTGGVNFISAVKLINSIMVAKSEEESFATFDAVRIDPDRCMINLIKSGAVSTLIRHRGSVRKISSPAFPVGIYGSSDIFSAEMNFDEGDIIIMFSDGIAESEYMFIREMLLKTDDIRLIADEVCGKSEVFRTCANPDDVTVIGIKLTKSE